MEFPEAPLLYGSGATSLLAKASCGTKRRPSLYRKYKSLLQVTNLGNYDVAPNSRFYGHLISAGRLAARFFFCKESRGAMNYSENESLIS